MSILHTCVAPDTQAISVTPSSSQPLSSINVEFTLSNPRKQDCVETYHVVDDQNKINCSNTSSSTTVECSGLDLCACDNYTFVGYARDGVSDGDRGISMTHKPDRSRKCVCVWRRG